MSVFLHKKLPLNTFLFEFNNLEKAYGRNSCYIFFKLKPIHAVGATSTTGTTGSELWGYATNKWEVADGIPRESPEKRGMHTEELLLDEMTRHVREHSGVGFCVEWFTSWSPCHRCSGLLLRWLRDIGGGRHRLRVWFSRIYYGDDGAVRAGLRRLRRAGVQLGVMDGRLHDYCAHVLVDAAWGDPTPPWLVPWHINVPRVQRAFDEIMDEKVREPGWCWWCWRPWWLADVPSNASFPQLPVNDEAIVDRVEKFLYLGSLFMTSSGLAAEVSI
uniref:CDA1L2 1 n=1 Tax=Lethenteron camtschaticum TaxID=980415 RepID=A0A2P1IQA1_LETCA|nr:cytidine deaminase [Lethenteron camtschaticum]QSL97325.1 CDA1L2_1 [Lethenteron camtschaticum]